VRQPSSVTMVPIGLGQMVDFGFVFEKIENFEFVFIEFSAVMRLISLQTEHGT
jgi:hypothetical protein